jgi:hypothetical protein
MPSRDRWVYFAAGVGTGMVKIGAAEHPASRLATLQAGSPVLLDLLAIEAGGIARERRLHCMFGQQRSHAEWFRLDGDLIRYIVTLHGQHEENLNAMRADLARELEHATRR